MKELRYCAVTEQERRELIHGEELRCSCGFPGVYDDMHHCEKEGYAIFNNAVWIARDGWLECVECYLK